MKKILLLLVFSVLAVVLLNKNVFAGPPFVNLEGVGGVAYNPLAYLADSGAEDSHFKIKGLDIIGKPRFGAWYVSLGEPSIDWTNFGVADTLFKRLEVSYGYQVVAWVGHPTFRKNNIGAKLLVVPEDSFDTKFIPAFSIGSIYKATSPSGVHKLFPTLRTTGQDWYGVLT
ncbi:MAG: hypothetical protein V1650_01060, partial [Candidatus Omnitrophota bacterium]